jgi:hydrogenase expression/formation protein HypE
MNTGFSIQCPTSSSADGETVSLAHGEGGRLMRRMLNERIFPILGIEKQSQEDSAKLDCSSGHLAFTTDCYVVSPLFFPGGDIGKLAVYGTVNDLAVSNARPRWLSLGLIIEDGLRWSILDAVLRSVAEAAKTSCVTVVTGDTKVVPRGTADQLFLITTGIGERMGPPLDGGRGLQVGDELIVTGPVGRHGVAVMAARESLDFRPPPKSDCASLFPAVAAMAHAGLQPRAMRDATRGGVAAVLHEWAAASALAITIDQERVPLSQEVSGVCELLGLDPLHIANEGTMVIAVPEGQANRFIAVLRATEVSSGAVKIGQVVARTGSPVTVCRSLGRPQPLDEPIGAPMPRIC